MQIITYNKQQRRLAKYGDSERFVSTALQRGLAARELSVCLSVRLSVKRVICDKTKQTCAHILIPHERSFTLVL